MVLAMLAISTMVRAIPECGEEVDIRGNLVGGVHSLHRPSGNAMKKLYR